MTRQLLCEALEALGHAILPADSAEEALKLLQGRLIDVALVDVGLPGIGGIELLRTIKARDPSIEVVIVTGDPAVRTAVRALKEGAYDYLQKPFEPAQLRHCVARALEHRSLRQEVGSLTRRLGSGPPRKELIGDSPAMTHLRETLARVATSDSSVLIEGESGTGKELAASAIHRLSAHAAGPFIPVNCSAIPPDLLESEFFGHARGAFSGAMTDTLGLFRSADGGTLFLDEVVDLPLPLQAKLLRVLEDGQVRPLGASKSYGVDVRIVAAANHPLADAVSGGRFRGDLYYRLNVVRIVMPRLREHKEDIPALVTFCLRHLNQQFGREVKGLSRDALGALAAYEFPGNVRELENLLEQAYALGVTREITAADLPALSTMSGELLPAGETVPRLAAVERELILRALRVHTNDREKAARALGISPRTLYRRLKKYGV